ncbi:MAG TPA: glycosyltransferase family 39 protein, partial [Candidatus Limnocylindrales bacterium]|nr:glycosyltransferase family 39 protein [Candidatus Limnocylindrales bacterium]
ASISPPLLAPLGDPASVEPAASATAAFPPPGEARWAAALGATAGAALVGIVVVARAGSALWTPAPTGELDRLLLVGALGSLLVMPALLWLLLGRGSALAPRPSVPHLEAIVVGAVAVAFGGVVVLNILQQPPFSWDEAVYALTTRHWLYGTPDTGWGAHRPPVLSILAMAPLAVASDEASLRVIGLAFGVAAVLATWWLGRSLAGPWAGVTAAAAVAAAPTIQIDAGLLLNDVPALAVLLLLMATLARQLQGSGPIGWSFLWLAPLAALAFYIRYGSILALAAVGLTAVALWPWRLAAAWPKVLVTALLLVLLLLPHAIFATLQTGSPLGIFLLAQSGAAGAYPGAGLVQYLAWLPSGLIGPVAGAVAVIGLLGGIVRLVSAARRGSWDPSARAAAFLLVPALLLIGVLGAFQLPQSRYLFLPMVLLVIAGAAAIVDVARAPSQLARPASVVVVAVLGLALVGSAVTMPARSDARAAVYEWLRDAGSWIRDAGPGSCSILASDVPQLTWYSGCATYNFADTGSAGREGLLTGERRYLVLRRDGRFQPSGEVLAAYLSLVDPEPVAAFENRNGVVVASVYRFAGH